ncbi:MAG: asparagine synthetase B family protein, partial [Acidobacteria bacterium]|nr:asparagine synthetase B family protein [Acidobacteriota bacterium]
VAEAIPFDALVGGSHEALYELKGEVVRRGMKRVLGLDFPVFPKRRFQEGAASADVFAAAFDRPPDHYRRHFQSLHG